MIPALYRLSERGFENAAREFDEALNAYKAGRFADVLTKANHAFESTMKVIAGKMGWKCEPTGTAKHLIKVMIDNGLLAKMRQSALAHLQGLLESEAPALRNKTPSAGHGAGEATNPDVPEYLAGFGIQTVAANINLLIDAYKSKKRP